MKKKSVKLLSLRKETIAVLSRIEKRTIFGGSNGTQNPNEPSDLVGCPCSQPASNCPAPTATGSAQCSC